MHLLRAPIFFAIICIMSFAANLGISAHESPTPEPEASVEFFVGVLSERAPGQTVYIIRFTMQPVYEIPAHSHPGTTILAVESGNLDWTLQEGTGHVVRSAASGGATEEIVESVSDVILGPGDTVYYEADTTHTARTVGNVPVKVTATHILKTGQPLQMLAGTLMPETEMTATPSS